MKELLIFFKIDCFEFTILIPVSYLFVEVLLGPFVWYDMKL